MGIGEAKPLAAGADQILPIRALHTAQFTMTQHPFAGVHRRQNPGIHVWIVLRFVKQRKRGIFRATHRELLMAMHQIQHPHGRTSLPCSRSMALHQRW